MGSIEFYIIYNWMRDELKLAGTELDCYAVIYSLSQSDNRYIAGVKRLMELLHKSEPTIIAALKALTKKGLITKEPVMVNNIKRNYYKAKRPSKDNQEPKEKKEEKAENGTTLNHLSNPLKSGEETTLNDLSSINNINNKYKDNKKKKELSSDNSKKEYSEEFLSFWSIYHNGGKQQAYRAWNKLKANEKQRAMDNVKDYLLFCKYKGRTQKDTSSYLNQKGFDEHWLATPDYYVVHDGDDGNLIKFKTYMVANHLELLFHRNPLTFEQIHDCFDKYTFKQTEIALNKLKQRDIHQYFSIAKGIEAVIADDPLFDEMEKEDEQ